MSYQTVIVEISNTGSKNLKYALKKKDSFEFLCLNKYCWTSDVMQIRYFCVSDLDTIRAKKKEIENALNCFSYKEVEE